MAKFSDLPFELRAQIFRLALPGPRLLHVIKRLPKPVKTLEDSNFLNTIIPFINKRSAWPRFTVSSASYGIYHPNVLSINRESREIARQVLTKHMGVYWNFSIDTPYFEIHDIRDKEAMWLTEVYRDGALAPFQRIAMDSILWQWPTSTSTMEFKYMHGKDFLTIMEPETILRQCSKIKTCILTYTDHTLQKDIARPYESWALGPMNGEVALNADFKEDWTYKGVLRELGSAELRTILLAKRLGKKQNQVPQQKEVRLMGIHGREREYFPPGKQLRPDPLPSGYYDWFG